MPEQQIPIAAEFAPPRSLSELATGYRGLIYLLGEPTAFDFKEKLLPGRQALCEAISQIVNVGSEAAVAKAPTSERHLELYAHAVMNRLLVESLGKYSQIKPDTEENEMVPGEKYSVWTLRQSIRAGLGGRAEALKDTFTTFMKYYDAMGITHGFAEKYPPSDFPLIDSLKKLPSDVREVVLGLFTQERALTLANLVLEAEGTGKLDEFKKGPEYLQFSQLKNVSEIWGGYVEKELQDQVKPSDTSTSSEPNPK